MITNNLGIIAGNGSLPADIAKAYSLQGGKVFIAAIEFAADVALIKDYRYTIFKIGQAGAIINYFKSHNVEKIVIIGGVNRPNLFTIKVDKEGAILLAQIVKNKFLGDNQLLTIITVFLESRGFKIVAPQKILLNKALYNTVITPDQKALNDIDIGFKAANLLGSLDIGQSVIVEDGYVLGLEGAEGTDNLIIRCAALRKKLSGGILVKIPKAMQDTRLDIPTIGPQTIEYLSTYQYSGLAISKEVIIADSDHTFTIANEANIFIYHILA